MRIVGFWSAAGAVSWLIRQAVAGNGIAWAVLILLIIMGAGWLVSDISSSEE